MHVRVLKPFPYSGDGIRLEALRVGEEVDIRDDLAPGLSVEGYIGPISQPAPTPAVPDPAAGFDPSVADATALRAFLAERGMSVHHKTGQAKLREMAAAELAKE